jgi:hypothetical protein
MTDSEFLAGVRQLALHHVTDRENIQLRDLARAVCEEADRRVQLLPITGGVKWDGHPSSERT